MLSSLLYEMRHIKPYFMGLYIQLKRGLGNKTITIYQDRHVININKNASDRMTYNFTKLLSRTTLHLGGECRGNDLASQPLCQAMWASVMVGLIFKGYVKMELESFFNQVKTKATNQQLLTSTVMKGMMVWYFFSVMLHNTNWNQIFNKSFINCIKKNVGVLYFTNVPLFLLH